MQLVTKQNNINEIAKKIGFEFELKIDPIFVYEFIKKMEEIKVVILINKLDK